MTRRDRGAVAHLSGAAAEDIVSRRYAERGYVEAARRWRSAAGEIDLILRKEGMVIFVEVKRAADLDTAAARLRPAQIARLIAAAEIFLGGEPGGTDSPARFDMAMVDGQGRVRVVANALGT